MSGPLALEPAAKPRSKKDRPVLKQTSDVVAALRAMYNPQAYAFFREIGNRQRHLRRCGGCGSLRCLPGHYVAHCGLWWNGRLSDRGRDSGAAH